MFSELRACLLACTYPARLVGMSLASQSLAKTGHPSVFGNGLGSIQIVFGNACADECCDHVLRMW
jgi:hypothetical protein